jgi:hypothetical protein
MNKDMGIGEKGRHDSVFVRSFRWTLSAANRKGETTLPDHFQKAVKFDFARQLIYLDAYEVILKDAEDIDIQHWLDKEDLHRHILSFDTYDGCGNELYQYNFYDLCIVGDEMEFDYASSEESVRKVVVKFGGYDRKYKANGKDKLVKPLKRYIYKISVNGSKAIDVDINDRPSIRIEESEVNHMNAKTWLPGKASWNNLHGTIRKEDEKYVVSTLLDRAISTTAELHVYSGLGEEKLETWKLGGVFLTQTQDRGKGYSFTLRYSEVEYLPTEWSK